MVNNMPMMVKKGPFLADFTLDNAICYGISNGPTRKHFMKAAELRHGDRSTGIGRKAITAVLPTGRTVKICIDGYAHADATGDHVVFIGRLAYVLGDNVPEFACVGSYDLVDKTGDIIVCKEPIAAC